MTLQTLPLRKTLKPRQMLAKIWKTWRLRAARRRQMRQLDRVLLDPHMARDIGLPARARPVVRSEFM